MVDQESIAARSELPPLRIHHLMIWIALTAPLLLLYIPRTLHSTNWSTAYAAYIYTEKIAAAAFGAAALLYLGLATNWRTRSPRFFPEPGQGLLLFGAWDVVDALVMNGARPIIRGSNPEALWIGMFWIRVFVSGMIFIPLACAWFFRRNRCWRLGLASKAEL